MKETFCLVPKKKLKRLVKEGGGQSEKSWQKLLDTFRETKSFASAKFYAAILRNNGITLDEGDLLTADGVTCSATALLRNLANSKTKLTNETKKYLEKLRARGNMPEAILADNVKIFLPSSAFFCRFSLID